jgi:outer membrane lipoprotein SlyB
MRGLAAIAGDMVLAAALVGCAGSDSASSTAASPSEIAEAVAIRTGSGRLPALRSA